MDIDKIANVIITEAKAPMNRQLADAQIDFLVQRGLIERPLNDRVPIKFTKKGRNLIIETITIGLNDLEGARRDGDDTKVVLTMLMALRLKGTPTTLEAAKELGRIAKVLAATIAQTEKQSRLAIKTLYQLRQTDPGRFHDAIRNMMGKDIMQGRVD